ncbi:MAG: polyprenyl synthetase family protein [Deltaproteobacteria bacterium]|nr:polyprenyl synthetase family protein [Deltaproteobacteria bacterium]
MKTALAIEAFEMIASELKAVEEFLHRGLHSEVALVPQVGSHILDSGGKRFRPSVLLLSARLCGLGNGKVSETSGPIEMAATMELIHTATLLHDDVVDNAPIRRGIPSANQLWGNEISVLIGDFILTKAFQAVIQQRDFRILDLLVKTTTLMAEGEALQLVKRRDMGFSEKDYLSVIDRKTAMLISNACQIGAILAKAEPEMEKTLADYGHSLGMAFQIMDDYLDYTADSEKLGKTIGKDLGEGKLTLPLIAALREASPQRRKKIGALLQKDSIENSDLLSVRKFIEEQGGLEYTQKQAHRHVEKAKASLSHFPDTPEKGALLRLADYVVERSQ